MLLHPRTRGSFSAEACAFLSFSLSPFRSFLSLNALSSFPPPSASTPTVFLDMHQEGLITPAKAKEGLHTWRSISKLAGADVTHGAAGSIARVLGLAEGEEEKEEDEWRQEEGGGVDSEQGLAHLQTLGKALQQSIAFQQEDDGVQALYLTTYAPREGVMVGASNAVFDNLFCGARELMAYQVHRQTASALLFAA